MSGVFRVRKKERFRLLLTPSLQAVLECVVVRHSALRADVLARRAEAGDVGVAGRGVRTEIDRNFDADELRDRERAGAVLAARAGRRFRHDEGIAEAGRDRRADAGVGRYRYGNADTRGLV